MGGRSGGSWRISDTTIVVLLLACSLGVVFFGFVPDLLRAAQIESDHAWRLASFLLATYHAGVLAGGFRARKYALERGETEGGPISRLPSVVGVSIIAAQLVTAAGYFSPWLFFFYLLALLWLLLMSTFMFAVLLLQSLSSRPAA